MGCRLNKLEKHDDNGPGNIYSTLKRPQVEMKTDIFYEYHFLDFTTLSNAELPRSAVIKLPSLCDLPLQLQDFYNQGFRLATIYPFLQPSNKNEKTIQEQIFRAVLIKKMERPLRREPVNEWKGLEIESCFFSDQLPDKSKIPDLIKKIQDAASRGLKFVGIVPQHVSQIYSKSTSAVISTSSLELKDDKNPLDILEDCGSLNFEKGNGGDVCKVPAAEEECSDQQMNLSEDLKGEQEVTEHLCLISSGELARQLQETEILALFNQPTIVTISSQYYPVTIPVRIINNGKSICGLKANWLEHMTDHFRKGSTLVHGIFNLGMKNDNFQGMTDGMFIFENPSVADSRSMQGYDAIVIEQWTILDGIHVQTDYIPLLNSLAVYGWQLTCVLPTPIVKRKRDGKLATKQIVFLQRPFLPQKNKKKQPKFHWRFSKQDQHQKQEKKPLKAKLSAGAQQQKSEETQESEATNRQNSEAQFSTNAEDRTVEHRSKPSYNSEMSAETWDARQSGDEDITGFCLSQKDAYENCESQMFQEHCTTANDRMCEAKAAETDWIPEVSAD
ncbi:raftlin [Erythrolamprus reginae]|uniref:raftlin n=1 Tax=Erythrolamprus reginae TaxID=121349 RepID=UPI00396D05C2